MRRLQKYASRQSSPTQEINLKTQATLGFTIVELLIVIVVIGILAAITIVAYNGIQGRARDAQRSSAMNNLKTAIELYYIDNGFYPVCNGDTICTSTGIYDPINLLPMRPPMPNDPINTATQYGYYYARGYKKNGNSSFIQTNLTTDYILATRLEKGGGSTFSGWDNSSLNYLEGN